ncbi:MAG TPA: ROK family protein [Terriglobales bacterium]|jgi:glucokinase|nr:ROK family protein [Terriglobales bacterium]
MPKAEHVVLGVDIGGTKAEAGLVNASGEILLTARRRMVVQKTAEDGLRAVTDAIEAVLSNRRARSVSAIGVSVAGWVDSQRGVLLSATNLPCWRNYPLAEKIQQRYKLPTRLANDANVAALAEAVWGAGVGYKNVFYVSLGTGIGTGLVLQDRLYYGRTGAAGEGGHITIDLNGPQCACGKRGCIEMYASGSAIGARARQLVAHNSHTRILELAEGKAGAVTSEIVGKAALDGDALANEILREAADYLSIWLGNIIDLLEPEVIVIGGGLGELMGSFFNYIRGRLDTCSVTPGRQQIPILSALYGTESSLVGSAALCLPRGQVWMERSRRAKKTK